MSTVKDLRIHTKNRFSESSKTVIHEYLNSFIRLQIEVCNDDINCSNCVPKLAIKQTHSSLTIHIEDGVTKENLITGYLLFLENMFYLIAEMTTMILKIIFLCFASRFSTEIVIISIQLHSQVNQSHCFTEILIKKQYFFIHNYFYKSTISLILYSNPRRLDDISNRFNTNLLQETVGCEQPRTARDRCGKPQGRPMYSNGLHSGYEC